MAPKVIFLVADYGHDPTETAVPWNMFTSAGFECDFATEKGKTPACDEKMLSGLTGALLGSSKASKAKYKTMINTSASWKKPHSWTDPSFSLDHYDLVFLPGGHEKGVRQIIDSMRVQELLASYFPQTAKPSKKSLAAICHGVQVLAMSSEADGTCVMYDCKTTALPAAMEQGIFQATRIFLGDYYKTYGKGTPSVQQIVTSRLANESQFVNSLSLSPFIVGDTKYNYISARFPGDAELLAQKAVEMVNSVMKHS